MENINDFLDKHKAPANFKIWAKDKTIDEIVNYCENGFWLLWLAIRLNIENRKIVLATSHCIELIKNIIHDQIFLETIEYSKKYGNNEISKITLGKKYISAYRLANEICTNNLGYTIHTGIASAVCCLAFSAFDYNYNLYAYRFIGRKNWKHREGRTDHALYALKYAELVYINSNKLFKADQIRKYQQFTAEIIKKEIGTEIIKKDPKQIS